MRWWSSDMETMIGMLLGLLACIGVFLGIFLIAILPIPRFFKDMPPVKTWFKFGRYESKAYRMYGFRDFGYEFGKHEHKSPITAYLSARRIALKMDVATRGTYEGKYRIVWAFKDLNKEEGE
jgi:hypothetical protein